MPEPPSKSSPTPSSACLIPGVSSASSPAPAPTSDPALGNGATRAPSAYDSLPRTAGLSPNVILWRTASDLVDRLRFGQDAGLAFGGLRDYDRSLGYNQRLTVSLYRERYNRWGIAKRIVEAFPQATWSDEARISEDPDPRVTTTFEKEVADLFTEHRLWQRFLRADILAGLGRFAVLLIGAPGDLRDELPQMSADQVLYFQPLAEDRVDAITFESDIENSRFGLPLTYQLNIGTEETVINPIAVSRTASTIETVHWTRVIHIADGLLDDDVFGTPRLRAVWNYLDDLMKVVGGGAEAAWRRADPGLNLNLDKDVKFDKEEAKALETEVEDYIHGLTRVIRTRGVDMNLLDSQVTAFGGNATSIVSLMSATTKIPQRILLGSERGELSSTQDRHNFTERVGERQSSYATPIVRDLIDRLGDRGVWETPDEYTVIWPEPTPDEGENAKIIQTLAAANVSQSQAEGVIVVTSNEIRESILGLDPLEDVLDLDDMPPPPPPPTEEEEEGGDEELTQAQESSAGDDQQDVREAVFIAARKHEPALAAAFLDAFSEVHEAVDLEDLARALETRDIPTATAILNSAWATLFASRTESVLTPDADA